MRSLHLSKKTLFLIWKVFLLKCFFTIFELDLNILTHTLATPTHRARHKTQPQNKHSTWTVTNNLTLRIAIRNSRQAFAFFVISGQRALDIDSNLNIEHVKEFVTRRERVITFMLSRNLPISRWMTSRFSSSMSASSSARFVFSICSSVEGSRG